MTPAGERCVEKWHARDCACDDEACDIREAARKRLDFVSSIVSDAVTKAHGSRTSARRG